MADEVGCAEFWVVLDRSKIYEVRSSSLPVRSLKLMVTTVP